MVGYRSLDGFIAECITVMVMGTFVQATYALVTFVHISNISAVIGPILIKLFGPNFFGVIIFVDQNVLGQNFFKTQYF